MGLDPVPPRSYPHPPNSELLRPSCRALAFSRSLAYRLHGPPMCTRARARAWSGGVGGGGGGGGGGTCAIAMGWRAVHASAYDKNLEDQVRPAFVPDDVIGGAANPDKYWGPHPKTGVFGPAAVDANKAAGAPDAAANGAGSVLDQKVWFRPLEDVEKPPPAA
uniref:Uncharacterized protein n=1 Tax=Setaria italica TaxID=4555 RepID=K3YAG1_SETIT